jgi:dTDP-4-amino-4,6-dideoxygalactose transaminase
MTMRAMMPPESQVLIPNISFAATVNSVLMAGHTPIFCDTDDQALIDLESMDYSLKGAGIRTIMYANLFGNVVDYDRFRLIAGFFNNDDNMLIIEDAAQSFGASYNGIPSGRLGDVSVLSFDPTKNLPNYGSGGMILTDDLGWAEELYDMRDNGKHEGHHFVGTNSRMSESDCAQMLIKLRHFDAWQDRRQEIAEYYTGELRDYVDVPVVADGVVHAWHKYVIRLSERHGLRSALTAEGIETRIHYDKTLTELPVSWKYDGYNPGQFRLSTAFTRECMSLPIYPEMTDGEIEQVVDAIQVYLR